MRSASHHEMSVALEATGYVFTDPVTDDRYPGITAYDPEVEGCASDVFPAGWGDTPTERDLAAMPGGA